MRVECPTITARNIASAPASIGSSVMSMPNEFWLFGQFRTALLSAEQLARLFRVTVKTIRNRAAAGTFPRPRKDGLWHIEDVAAYLDCTTRAPFPLKPA